MSTDATLRALTRDDDDLPFCCLRCNHLEQYDADRCTQCHLARGES